MPLSSPPLGPANADASSSNTLNPVPPGQATVRPVSAGFNHLQPSVFLSRLSHELHPDDIAESSTDNEGTARPQKRFSLMRFRNKSESHLAARAKMDQQKLGVQEESPPVSAADVDGMVPTIVKTAPTTDNALEETLSRDEERDLRGSLFKRGSSRASPKKEHRKSTDERRLGKKNSNSLRWRKGKTERAGDSSRRLSTDNPSAPPSYGDESTSALAVPLAQFADPRVSESSRSDGSNASSGDGHIYASTTTTTHTVSTHTTFFRLPRRNRNRNSLFPLPVQIPPQQEARQHAQEGPPTPRASVQLGSRASHSTTEIEQQPKNTLQRRHTETKPIKKRRPHSQSVPSPHAVLARGSLSFAEPEMHLARHSSRRSQSSTTSSPLQPPMPLGFRNRSSTTSSLGRSSNEAVTPPPPSTSGRNSMSTTGRSSLGGFLSLSRFRQSSEPHSPRHVSPGPNSKANSFAISREALVIPERGENDNPLQYLERLEGAVSRSVIAGILSKSGDPFAAAVLRSYTRKFPFFGEPIDMSLRKFLLESELPKETQQVDRVIQAFADRYHECNPGIFLNSDQAYVIAFSIMMLHTDAFNKNNKRKMQKQDYLKNTSGQGLADDILACFYDNICYTPFVHYDEDVDINGEKILPFKPKKTGGKLKSAIPGAEVVKRTTGPVDPYNLLIEQKLDTLRPAFKDNIEMDDPYDYRGSQGELDVKYLQRAFTHTGVLQIISARSRPAAYESQFVNGAPNPTETQQGIVDLKITKVGTLWRKSSKKKKTRSPWQEWGAILTGSQLYLFKNSHWAKGLMHQFVHQQKPGHPRIPVIFKPPLPDFKPDALIKTDNAVALVDQSYQRHKHAFIFVRPGGQEEVLLADNEHELNDWLGLINYAAAFRAAGVRIRGMLGGTEEDLRSKDAPKPDLPASKRSIQTADGEITVQNRGLSPTLQRQVMAARRSIMVQKIGEIETEIAAANKQLENMVRNARHLLILAPIASKTREDVIHAAARADAMMKWMRRDIWRLKCHRDVLAMDVRLDGLHAGEVEQLTQDHANKQVESEPTKKERPRILPRLNSSKAVMTRSSPQSPPTIPTGMPSANGSFGNDVFRTPPESASPSREEGWRLPPLNLDSSTQGQHRPSVANTLLSVSTLGTQHGSLTHSSSQSSMLQVQRTNSSAAPETGEQQERTTPRPSIDEKELERLARSTIGPAQAESLSRALGVESQPSSVSPTNKHKGGRRSLQKTLRDHHNSTHKHRRNKESDSTVRSAGIEDKDAEEATPGLQRDKPRFILHGKQASVVQFGGDWERMRMRREQYDAHHPTSPNQADREAVYADFERRRSEQHELFRAGMTSPAVQDLGPQSSIDEDDSDSGSLSARSQSFREDAEAAAAYTAAAAPLTSRDILSSFQDDHAIPETDDFDWSTDADRRRTIIGPSKSSTSAQQATPDSHLHHHRRVSSLEKDEDGNVRIVDEDDDDDPERYLSPETSKARENANRRTVIGPSHGLSGALADMAKAFVVGKGKETDAEGDSDSAGGVPSSAAPSVVESSLGHVTDSSAEAERGSIEAISDEELRKMSSGLDAMKTL